MANDRSKVLVELCTQPLRTHTPEALLASHSKIHELCKKTRQRPGSNQTMLDLQQCGEIDSGAMLLLMHSGMQIFRMGGALTVAGPSPAFETVNRHLLHLRATRQERATIPAEAADYLLRGVGSREEMVAEIDSWALKLREAANADPEEVALWQVELAEVTTNSFQHGPRLLGRRAFSTILVAGKAYPAIGAVQIAALDFGSGIPRVIEHALGTEVQRMHDGQKIAYACRPGVTSRCDRFNQGAGLASLVDTVKKNRGSLQILSQNGLAHVSNQRMYARRLAPRGDDVWLNGTLTIINLKLSRG